MAEISVLPVTPVHAGAAHILSLLAAATEEGRDLGSRVPHMRVQAHALDHLVRKLKEDLQGVRRALEARQLGSPEAVAALGHLDRLVREVQTLVDMVQAYPGVASGKRA